MCNLQRQCLAELSSLLQRLGDSWGAGESSGGAALPNTLAELLHKAKLLAGPPAPPTTTASPTRKPHNNSDHDVIESHDDHAGNNSTALPVLLEIARFVLPSHGGAGSGGGGDGWAGTTRPKARSRALALDCLRLGLLLPMLLPRPGGEDGNGSLAREAFAAASVGGRDERWEVRAAAARAAGEALRLGGIGELLSSQQGCWLPALLVDGYPEVENAARLALTPSPALPNDYVNGDDKEENDRQPPSLPPSNPSLPSPRSLTSRSSSGVAAIRGACEALRGAALAAASVKEEEDSEGLTHTVAVDLAEEEAMRTALRALRGGASLMGVPPMTRGAGPCPPSDQRQREDEDNHPDEKRPGGMGREETETAAARVEALESIEAWLESTVKREFPVLLVPWASREGGAQGATSGADAAPGGSLSLEARDAVRAILVEGGVFGARALEAAASAVGEFRTECLEAHESEEEEEDLWRRIYCALLVRLEAFCFPAGGSEPSVLSGMSTEGGGLESAMSSMTVSSAGEKPGRIGGGGGGNGSPPFPVAIGDTQLSPFIPLAEMITEALEEIPFAHEEAVPSSLEHDENMPVREKRALRALGGRRQRWLVSSGNLLLRAGLRLCERCRRSVDATAVSGCSNNNSSSSSSDKDKTAAATTTVVKLLAAALPFQEAWTTADDPTDAWLSSVRPEKSPLPTPATTSATTELASPVPWESCVNRQALAAKHELPAPWASSPSTTELASDLADTAWSTLFLGNNNNTNNNNTAASTELMETLRAAARARGGWRDGAGVSIKHAASAAIRRLRFPLVTGATLGHALPLALPLADDYDPSHQAVGFSLLLHLIEEASPTELGWHRGLLLEVLERGLRGGGRDPPASTLCLAAAVRLLRRSSIAGGGGGRSGDSAGRAGIRMAREALAQASRATEGVARAVMLCGAAGLLELPATGEGYAPCEFLRPALLGLLPVLQSSPVSTRLDARGAALRAVHALCLSCWPRVHAHASKLLCALLWTCGDCARRASVRDGAELPGVSRMPLGVMLAANHAAVDPARDEAVRVHATRLGALVLVLVGDEGREGGKADGGGGGPNSARKTLREICAAVTALRPAGSAMEQLADEALLSGRRKHQAGPAADAGVDGGGGGRVDAGKDLDRADAAYRALQI